MGGRGGDSAQDAHGDSLSPGRYVLPRRAITLLRVMSHRTRYLRTLPRLQAEPMGAAERVEIIPPAQVTYAGLCQHPNLDHLGRAAERAAILRRALLGEGVTGLYPPGGRHVRTRPGDLPDGP